MAVYFENTTRALGADQARRGSWLLAAVCILLIAWVGWFGFAQVPVYQVAEVAALEGGAAAHPVSAEIDGRVKAVRLELGRVIASGEALVELDAQPMRLAMDESRTRLAGLQLEREALGREIERERLALEAHKRSTQAGLAEAQGRVAEAEPRARFAEDQVVNRRALHARQMVAEEALRQAESQAQSARAAVDALVLLRAKLEREAVLQSADRQTRLARLQSDLYQIESQIGESAARQRRFEHEIALHEIRAPIAGRLGRVIPVKPGAVVRAGDVLAIVVPEGPARAVAYFPVEAVGRVQPGQSARLRLHGFPWLRFGMPRATVVAVGSESAGGGVRVELGIDPGSAPLIPLQHGLAGSAEVEIERVSPIALVLRSAGKLLNPPAISTAASDAHP